MFAFDKITFDNVKSLQYSIMALSTIESWNHYKAAEEHLKGGGLKDSYEERIRGRIRLVVDSSAGRRTLRNLWGLKPVRQQELFKWEDGGGLFPESTFVGGRHFDFHSEAGELGEELVGTVINEFGDAGTISEQQEEHDNSVIKTTLVLGSESGVAFRRTSYRENRRLRDGDVEEFVPGFLPTFAFFWDVVFSPKT